MGQGGEVKANSPEITSMTRILSALFAAGLLAQCAAPIPPVEVTRFHTGDTQKLGPAMIRAAEGLDAEGLEFRTYAAAVSRELVRLGFADSREANSPWIAEVGFSRGSREQMSRGSPVSIGVGGGTYGRNVGIGVGTSFPLGESNRSRTIVLTRLSVRLLNRADGKAVWEGRAETSAPASAPSAKPGLAAEKLASALFAGFPGRSGETITIP